MTEKPGLSAIEKGEACKRATIDIFNRNWKKYRDIEIAYERALTSLGNAIEKHEITNQSQLNGVNAELIFYRNYFQTYKLRPESASGLHSDFAGIYNGKPSVFDVTTNISSKSDNKFQEISESFGDDWDYYLALVDLEKSKIEMSNLILPICKDGTIGHFMLILFDSDTKSLAECSDSQMLVKYNPKAGDEDDAIEEVISDFNYILEQPEMSLKNLTPDDDFEIRNPFEDFKKSWTHTANHFRRESGYLISSIVSLKEVFYGYKMQDSRWETRKYWVHPHNYIKKSIGDEFDDLDHNIAGVAYEQY